MGTAEPWQERTCNAFDALKGTLFNPRRTDWDSSWVQRMANAQFNEQVTWELDALARADIIMMYFDPATKSPISLLELGLYAASLKMLVCCPDGYWRKGNVEMVCQRFDIPLYETLEELLVATAVRLV